MKIITVSRQFGSGGRELGKRLSDLLGWDYYDREIITSLAEQQGLDPEYVRHLLATHGWQQYQLTYRHSFQQVLAHSHSWNGTELLLRQKEMIRKIAEAGNNCIIVGRDADVLLQEEQPFRVYVCAELSARLARCMAYEERKEPSERLDEKEILRNIRRIDKRRIHTREVLTGRKNTDGSSFDLTVNTTFRTPKILSEAVAEFAAHWFDAR